MLRLLQNQQFPASHQHLSHRNRQQISPYQVTQTGIRTAHSGLQPTKYTQTCKHYNHQNGKKMNEATLNSIRTGFQSAHNTLLSAQKFPVIGVFASVAQFFVSIAELITAAAIAPIPLRIKASLLSNTQEYCDRKHCQDSLAREGIDALVISVINVAILGFPVAAYHYGCKPEEAGTSVTRDQTKDTPGTSATTSASTDDVDILNRLIPKEHKGSITEDFYDSFVESLEKPGQDTDTTAERVH